MAKDSQTAKPPEGSKLVYAVGRATPKRAGKRGPKSGANDRFGDRRLFKQMTRLMKNEHLSEWQAAAKLAHAGKVAGVGSLENRARRLAIRYRKEVLGKSKN